ncbi:MAG: class I SAM-dependent methyltransferase [Clostridiales bacterium]|nr:class I SAM-dependent methyltransferase [Clostridiales bacterium]
MNDVEQLWNKMAKAYEEFTSGDNSYSNTIEWPCIQKMLPDIKGKSVIDLGCGSGRYTFLLEEAQPRKVVGVDISDEMLRLAREKAEARGSSALFIKGDLNDFVPDDQYDVVFSSTMSHYIVDLFPLFANIYDMLTYRGIGIISVMNPIYSAQYPIKNGEWNVRYLDKSERSYVQPWCEGDDDLEQLLSCSYHHTFSDYMNAIIHNGLTILEMQEPLPPESWKSEAPSRYDAFIETPSYLIIKLQKK